jgi:GTP cyclohydrolase IB
VSVALNGLPDVQAGLEGRGVELDEVGVAGLSLPVQVAEPDGLQSTVASAEFTVALRPDVRGTHMSRFVELLTEAPALDAATLAATTRRARSRLDADRARLIVSFPLFVERIAPTTGMRAPLRYDASFEVIDDESTTSVWLGVDVPITSLCPCSKEIADYGAHSQRGRVRVQARPAELGALSLLDLFAAADTAGSAPVYPLLKRPDERAVTMTAYDNPQFVEDIARDVAVAMRDDECVAEFFVEVENQESIHDHQAIARVRWARP